MRTRIIIIAPIDKTEPTRKATNAAGEAEDPFRDRTTAQLSVNQGETCVA